MEKLIIFALVNLVFYGLFSFICMDLNPLNWHWVVRLIVVFLEIGIIGESFKD